MADFELWYEKYRPHTLEGYVWVDNDLKSRINHWLAVPEKLPHLFLHGPAGTGKTTLALIIGEAVVEEPEYDLLFIATNKHSGVDAIRDEVTGFCETGGFGGLKVVIIDEADGLSYQAQEKLKSVINEFGSFVRFIFTTNNIQTLNDPLKSRGRIFEIKALNEDEFLNRMISVLETEEVEVDVDIVATVFDMTYPDLRKAIDLLQDCERDKALISPSESSVGVPEWSEGVASIILNSSGAGTIREVVTSLRKDEIINVYRYLYENSAELFDVRYVEMTAITVVASYLKTHATVAFPDINLAGCLIDLVRLKEQSAN